MANYPSIQDPAPNPEALRQAVLQLKEAVEILTRQRRPIEAAAVTWSDLLELELISQDQIPRR